VIGAVSVSVSVVSVAVVSVTEGSVVSADVSVSVAEMLVSAVFITGSFLPVPDGDSGLSPPPQETRTINAHKIQNIFFIYN